MRFSQSTHLLIFLSLENLTAIARTGLPILVELINLVNSVIIFLSQTTLLRWLTFPLGSLTVTLNSPALLDLFISSDASICSTNSDHVVASVSIVFPSYPQQDALFHHIAYGYSCTDWDSLCDHLRDVPWEGIFNSMLQHLLVNFVIGFRLELMYISLIKSIRSSLTHLHGFQLLVLLPWFIEITFFVCTKRINLLSLK